MRDARTPPEALAPRESVVSRFLRYVRIDTQSREGVAEVPSSTGQWNLARGLAHELVELGATDVRLSDTCIVYATIPTNLSPDETAPPVVGFIAHVDTSPAVRGAGVTPIVHENYQGGDLVLPGDPTQVLTVARHPVLRTMVGDDIITTDGTTLLGSDDKAGVAAIMTLVDILGCHPAIPHGTIAVAFTADEEIGIGMDRFDVEGFGADVAYTVDGEALGEINHETFHARGATVTFRGVSAHPGSAKGIMVNAAWALAEFLSRLPAKHRPERTSGREGFIHPYSGTLDAEVSVVTLILRDFDEAAVDDQEDLVRRLAADVAARHRGLKVDVGVREQYRNMNDVLRHHPQLVQFAIEATRRAGLEPVISPVRGGTDGAKLTFRGLPCPNIFTGGHNFHSPLEFNSRRGLEKTAETLVHLVQVFAERTAATTRQPSLRA